MKWVNRRLFSQLHGEFTCKPKLDNLLVIFTAGSDISILLDSRRVLLPYAILWLGQCLQESCLEQVLWAWMEQDNLLPQGGQPQLWSCQRLLSFQHPPFHTPMQTVQGGFSKCLKKHSLPRNIWTSLASYSTLEAYSLQLQHPVMSCCTLERGEVRWISTSPTL